MRIIFWDETGIRRQIGIELWSPLFRSGFRVPHFGRVTRVGSVCLPFAILETLTLQVCELYEVAGLLGTY